MSRPADRAITVAVSLLRTIPPEALQYKHGHIVTKRGRKVAVVQPASPVAFALSKAIREAAGCALSEGEVWSVITAAGHVLARSKQDVSETETHAAVGDGPSTDGSGRTEGIGSPVPG